MKLSNKKAMINDIIEEINSAFDSSWWDTASDEYQKQVVATLVEIVSDYTDADSE